MVSNNNLKKAASDASSKFFSSAEKITTKKKNTPIETQVKGKKAATKQVFSFRGEKEDVKAWRLYAAITGMKVDDLGSLAMKQYLENHPLKGAEKALFDEKLNR